MHIIRDIYLSATQEAHMLTKHHVTPEEMNEVCYRSSVDRAGRDTTVQVYRQASAGPLSFRRTGSPGQGDYQVVTAPSMDTSERRYYQSRMR